ncbi:MAG: GLUG motif-containing protein, partial [Candidatus Thermoplasmatota archaeon]|nr:GLUG motif-containing protein [Candidatus Thermoplasmatota archaeon]
MANRVGVQNEMKLTACSIVGILIAAAFVGLLANPMQNVGAAPYQDGSIESPWLIYNVQELQDKMNLDLGAHYALAVDIDGSATSTWNGGEGFDPVGNDTGSYWDGSKWVYPNSFTGSLDGRNLTITGLYINRPTKDYVGLFGTTNGDVVKNVGLMNCDITGQNYVGGIAGNKEGGVVENSYATGTVTGRGSLGGLMGQNSGVVENSYADVSVTGTHALIGGLVGGNWGGTVNNCHATGAVLGATTNGYGQVGGLVGDSSGTVTNSYATGDTTATNTWGHSVGGLIGKNSGLVEDSYATGATSATYSYAGGLVGYNEGIISGCHAAGSATSESRVGGLVGWNRYDGNVEQSYATGAAAGASHVGGLVGANGGETWDAGTPTITNCYSTGTVTRNSGSETTFGGFVGSNIRGKITNCYSTGVVMGFTDRGFVGGLDTAVPYEMRGNFWDNETSGQSSSAGSVDGGSELPQGRNTAEMKTLSTFMDASWNFVDVWYMTGGYTYPLLLRHYVPFQVNLRDTPGFQLVSIPCNQELLASRNWTAYDLAADIEANTDIQV